MAGNWFLSSKLFSRMRAQLAVLLVLLFSGTADATVLRLQGSLSEYDGRVEVLYEKEWGSICDVGWDLTDANVTCKQLGFLLSVGVTAMSFYGGAGEDVRVWVEGVECEGNESDIGECVTAGGWGNVSGDCENHTRDAGVICANDPNALSVRLVGGATESEGRVEVLFGDGWGGVCDDGWGLEEANVVCRQLGYDLSEAIPTDGDFGEGGDVIWMDEVVCEGNERRLADCQHAGWAHHDCQPLENAKVQCTNLNTNSTLTYHTNSTLTYHTNCTVRIVPLSTLNRPWLGAVELFVNDEWGRVCSDTWDLHDAFVLCQQLGYQGALEATTLTTDPPSGLYWLAGVECMGSEDNLCECPSNGAVKMHSNCTTRSDAGIVCEAVDGNLRLVGGANEWEGRVEVSVNNEWGTVCSFGISTNDVIVICRQLGYHRPLDVYFGAVFGAGSGVQWFDNFTCSGTEDSIFNCPRGRGIGQIQSGCSHHFDLSVICQADPSSDNETAPIRLVGGATPYVGGVEVLYNGRWGRVCDDEWNMAATEVTCRQLGYGVALDYGTVSLPTTELVPVWLDDVMCNGTETALSACPHSMWGENDCSPNTAAGVNCSEPARDPHEVRLVGGPVEHSGRVEILYGGVWGTVCDIGWDIDDAEVVCRQLGYPDAISLIGRGEFTEGVGVVWLEGIDCHGNETRLTECGLSNWGDSRCDHTHDAGVICESPKSVSSSPVTSSDVVSMPTTSQLMLLPLSSSYDEQATPTSTITMDILPTIVKSSQPSATNTPEATPTSTITMDILPTIVKSSQPSATNTPEATPTSTDNLSTSDSVINPVIAIGAISLIGVALVTVTVMVVLGVVTWLYRRRRRRRKVWDVPTGYMNRMAEDCSLSISFSSLPEHTVVYNEETEYPPGGAEDPPRGAEDPPGGAEDPPGGAEDPPGESLDSSMDMSQKRTRSNGDYDSLEIFSPTIPPHHSTPTHPPTHSPIYTTITELQPQPLAKEGTTSNNDSPPSLIKATFV